MFSQYQVATFKIHLYHLMVIRTQEIPSYCIVPRRQKSVNKQQKYSQVGLVRIQSLWFENGLFYLTHQQGNTEKLLVIHSLADIVIRYFSQQIYLLEQKGLDCFLSVLPGFFFVWGWGEGVPFFFKTKPKDCRAWEIFEIIKTINWQWEFGIILKYNSDQEAV